MMQPTLHDSHVLLTAPTQVVAARDGRVETAAEGIYHGDVRAVCRLRPAIAGTVDWVGTELEVADRLVQRFIVRGVGEEGPDPELVVTRELTVRPGVVTDRLTFDNVGTGVLEVGVAVDIASDLARMDAVKAGRATDEVTPKVTAVANGHRLRWANEHVRVSATVPALENQPRRLVVKPGQPEVLDTRVEMTDQVRTIFLPVPDPAALVSGVRVEGSRHDLVTAVSRSVADLRSLLLADAEEPRDVFVAAGAPWYLTLFGRDALWASKFLMLTGTDLAMGTLRALARRQATAYDQVTQAEPGKILHEVRAEPLDLGGGVVIPPLYYGTIDATALWIILLHAAWKHGAPDEEVAALLPHLDAALNWLESSAGDGFLRYVDSTGRGLANQGWKDSADGIRHRDGSRGQPPVALCEVQGYAYQAAVQGAELQRHFGVGDPGRREEWAAGLALRFRARFWVDSQQGPHPAVALDGDGRPVSALTSNIGHVLGTGLCNAEESAAIARLLVSPELSSGHGLRTMATSTGGFNPLGYHTGSVWTHDTMIAASGLAAAGFRHEAESLVLGLLDASTAFRGQMPELHGGYAAVPGGSPTAYAASCHPQGWSAASMLEGLRLLLGLTVDVPHGVVTVDAPASTVLRGHRVDGLVIGGEQVSLTVTEDGLLDWAGLDRLEVVTG